MSHIETTLDTALIEKATHKLKHNIARAKQQEAEAREALKFMQNMCPHKYEEQGHDHNYVYYKCRYCKKEKRV